MRWFTLILVAAFGLPSSIHADSELLQLQQDDKQWVMPAKNYAGTRYSSLDQITTANIKNLRPAWTFSTGVLRGHEGAPLVVDSTMYVHTPFPNTVYALDLLREGAPIKWKYAPKQDPEVVPIACCDTISRGLAYAEGKLFLNQLDTHLVARSCGRSSRETIRTVRLSPALPWSSRTK